MWKTKISQLLQLDNAMEAMPCVMAVIGCGGKTSLIEGLAHEFAHKKVLVSPTTKIRPMTGEGIWLCETAEQCSNHRPQTGIQCMGIGDPKTGKLTSLAIAQLEELVKGYDLALLEADGSRGLPCKGWLTDEPVIPEFCTHTVGVVTLNGLGRPVDENTVLRFDEFFALTGLREGQIISLSGLTDMVCAPNGMFGRARGKKCLIVNQAESPQSAALGKQWLEEIKKQFPGFFSVTAYGSVQQNQWQEV